MKVLKKITFSLLVLTMILFVALMLNIEPYNENKGSENINNQALIELENKYKEVSSKVVPYQLLAKIEVKDNIYVGEIIEDKGNGKTYCVEVEDTQYWVDNYYVTILDINELTLTDLTNEEIELYVNYSMFKSNTDYFIWVDIYRNQTYILHKKNEYFFMIDRLSCATGSNKTPTKRGLFVITSKGEEFLGRDKTYKCYNFMQYSGSYLLHSFPYNLDNSVKDDRLNARVSNGCVRYSLDDSKYLYDLIPLGTAIWLN